MFCTSQKEEHFKNTEKDITKLDALKIFLNIFSINGAKFSNIENENDIHNFLVFIKKLDKIYDVLSKYKEVEKRFENLNNNEEIKMFLLNYFEQQDLKSVIDQIANNPKFSTSQTHSLSYKVFDLVNIDLFITEQNLSNFKFDDKTNLYKAIEENEKELESKGMLNNNPTTKYLDDSFLKDVVISLSVKTSLVETIKVFN